MSPQLIALFSAISYGSASVFARLGLRFSNPPTAACCVLSVRTVTLWSAVLLTGGPPRVAAISVILFVFLGVLQTAITLLTLTGIHRIGASRSAPLRNTYPLWSAVLAMTVLEEEASAAVLAGTLLVVVGVGLISWQPAEAASTQRWWHVLSPLGAALLAGIAFPVRRYALIVSNEPLFFAALLAAVSLVGLPAYFLLPIEERRPAWHRSSLPPFILAGLCETTAALLSLVALGVGDVVVVAPIVATTPLWTLVVTVVLLRGIERVTPRTAVGTACVVGGTIAIIMAR